MSRKPFRSFLKDRYFLFSESDEKPMRTLRIEPEIGKTDLVRLLGGRNGSVRSSSVSNRIDTWTDRIHDLIEPHLSYLVRPIERVDAFTVTVNGVSFTSSRISRALRACTDAVCFIATIDEGIEREVKKLMLAGKLSEAYILDSMGSVAVEGMVAKFHEQIEATYRRSGRSVTIRFSPGYCDWNISEQKKLFSLFDTDKVPVTLHRDTWLMGPRKSVSGIFGILPYDNGGIAASYNPCTECAKTACIARRAAKKAS